MLITAPSTLMHIVLSLISYVNESNAGVRNDGYQVRLASEFVNWVMESKVFSSSIYSINQRIIKGNLFEQKNKDYARGKKNIKIVRDLVKRTTITTLLYNVASMILLLPHELIMSTSKNKR